MLARPPSNSDPMIDRRSFVEGAAVTIAAITSAALGGGAAAAASFSGEIKGVDAGLLHVAYVDSGPAGGTPVILLHGWPYDIHSFAEVAPILAGKGYRIIVPFLRGFGGTRFLSADTVRSGEPGATATDLVALMDALHIRRAILGGFDWGARTADVVAALWPERVTGLVSVSGYLIGSQAAGRQPLPPEAEYQWWYQFYFATERGRLGYQKNTRAFNKLIWQLASPKWKFDDATFERSAAAFDNPDHIDVVIHNYRWRMGLADGDPRYSGVERRLEALPAIAVPTITMEGDANGSPHPPAEAYRSKFTGRYEHRLIGGGIGHNLPQESPAAFAQAVVDVARGV
jgi:pimeloyl-ACP methyl ester carboxylesterase